MDNWVQRLSNSGCRITASRRAVVGVLQQTEVPLTPHEILELARAVHPRLGLVTVYRTLNLIAAQGLLRRVHRHDGCHAYLPASQGHNHAVICRRCGRAVEFAGGDDIEALVARVEQATSYRIDGHLLQLSGLCRECIRSALPDPSHPKD
jgi:Fur family ferric uptake transcriptional regulator